MFKISRRRMSKNLTPAHVQIFDRKSTSSTCIVSPKKSWKISEFVLTKLRWDLTWKWMQIIHWNIEEKIRQNGAKLRWGRFRDNSFKCFEIVTTLKNSTWQKEFRILFASMLRRWCLELCSVSEICKVLISKLKQRVE